MELQKHTLNLACSLLHHSRSRKLLLESERNHLFSTVDSDIISDFPCRTSLFQSSCLQLSAERKAEKQTKTKFLKAKMDIRKYFNKEKAVTTCAETVTIDSDADENNNTEADSSGEEPEPTASSSATVCSQPHPARGDPDCGPRPPQCPAAAGSLPADLGAEKPAQVRLESYPTRMFYNRERSFSRSWFNGREWLGYSVVADAAFCYPCRKFSIGSSANSDKAFTETGFTNWKTAMEKSKGFARHEASKEHMKCTSLWKEYISRRETDAEVSTLVNEGQLARNRLYLSAVVDVIEFLVTNHQPLRGTYDDLESRAERSHGMFLSMMDYTLRKDKELAQVFATIPKNATYTSHDIQNKIIAIMSDIVTSEIVKELGESWYTLKVDGTKDPTGCENVSIVLRFLNMDNEVRERLLVMATTEHCDALSLTNMVLSELNKAGVSTDKLLSQCYDGANVMYGKKGGVQKILQDKVQRVVPYVHCFNHQLHLVVIHSMSAEDALQDFFEVCDMLYRFLKKPTVAVVYKGERLKRLLDQRWTGHLATVSVIVNSYDALVQFFAQKDSSRRVPPELKVEAVGLLNTISESNFMFTAVMVQRILLLMDPANQALQSKTTDLYTGVKVVKSALVCVEKLRSDVEFQAIWTQATTQRASGGQGAQQTTMDTEPPLPKRVRTVPAHLQQYVVESTVGQEQLDRGTKEECKRLFFSTLDNVIGEMKTRFSERNSKLVEAMGALDPVSKDFLDPQKIKPLLELSNTAVVESQFDVAKEFLQSEMAASSSSTETWTPRLILQKYAEPLKAMPGVLTALKHGFTFGASSATCENTFSTLTMVFTEHRRSMHHQRKANLIQLAFEGDLTKQFQKDKWKDLLLRKFNAAHKRRLQLY